MRALGCNVCNLNKVYCGLVSSLVVIRNKAKDRKVGGAAGEGGGVALVPHSCIHSEKYKSKAKHYIVKLIMNIIKLALISGLYAWKLCGQIYVDKWSWAAVERQAQIIIFEFLQRARMWAHTGKQVVYLLKKIWNDVGFKLFNQAILLKPLWRSQDEHVNQGELKLTVRPP